MQAPDILFQELFVDVQLGHVFPDSKTFVDCTPRESPEHILELYRNARNADGFDLRAFVLEYFDLPRVYSTDFHGDPARPIEEHIQMLWKILQRSADTTEKSSSLIPLPRRYIVPGGRFGEIYYWDSYFTILGLLSSGETDLAKDMLSNFAYLIQTIGHIPNGNRTYFLSRSQPPFFALMVREVALQSGDESLYNTHASHVEKEYNFWMDHAVTAVGYPSAFRRSVKFGPDEQLNRYWDDFPKPRQESYREDVELAETAHRDPEQLYRDIRAACESGWDFSTRWFARTGELESIETTSILPVDLNCLLWSMEFFLSRTYAANGDADRGDHYHTLSERRRVLISKYFWNPESKTFRDFHFIENRPTHVESLAMAFPLYMQIATAEQAAGVAEAIRRFLKPGGLVSTVHHTGQQWDAPNGWAPLQWIAYKGLKNYGFDTIANAIASNWKANVLRVYQNTGKLVEKYDVEDITLEAGGGEYPVQDGFGWTNGVMIRLLEEDS